MQRKATVSLTLPAPVAAYFSADTSDAEAVARCFTEDAVVIDEKHAHTGRAEIAEWNAASSRKYRYTTEPLAIEASGSDATVTARLTGSFPGSPVELDFRFTLEGAAIRRLEIG